MSRHKPGTRVWAVRNADENAVYAFGFGTYVGDEVADELATPDAESAALYEQWIHADDQRPAGATGRELAEWLRDNGQITAEDADRLMAEDVAKDEAERQRPMADRVLDTHRLAMKNPKIVLDDGRGVVWGRECWWGPASEGTPERYAKGRTVVLVDAPHPAEAPA